ncbi:BTB/POZ domain-containing protein At1g63850 isoform X2 [Cryptomeria japonica]|nr:BTB/POZ domain-containing protein At1g63850 isoform X2 [Cryptomeria japonica]
MMYSLERFTFSSVQEALSLLQIASELLFTDCLNSCMQYLEAVPWSAENEHQIRASIMSLQLHLSPDLAVRLSTSGCVQDFNPLNTMGEILSELLSLVSNGASSKAREITKRVLHDNMQITTSPTFADVNKSALFRELQNNLDIVKSQLCKFANYFSWNSYQISIASSALCWLLDEMFALEIADMAVKMIAEEQELAQLVVSRIYQNPFTETLFKILVRLLRALQIGQVICQRSVRLSLVKTWLPVIAKLTHDDEYLIKDNELHNSLEEGMSSLVTTLPMADQEQIFKIWISSCLRSKKAWPDLSTAFDMWCNKLRQAQCEIDLGPSLHLSEASDPHSIICSSKNHTYP